MNLNLDLHLEKEKDLLNEEKKVNDIKIIQYTKIYKQSKQSKQSKQNTKREKTTRIVVPFWKIEKTKLEELNELEYVSQIIDNQNKSFDRISQIILSEIYKKLQSYKYQDIKKNRYNSTDFIQLTHVLCKMKECALICRYCDQTMIVLYDISRETLQWSIDRLHNDNGHNVGNFHLACLKCNLTRRCCTDEKFFFTKHLKLIKSPNIYKENENEMDT